ncbi:MAG: hypothetical protein HY056_02315, partial [Proteobacteria bacterium]|nr:hypothetical protein [Pseudomonadota bacterium]
ASAIARRHHVTTRAIRPKVPISLRRRGCIARRFLRCRKLTEQDVSPSRERHRTGVSARRRSGANAVTERRCRASRAANVAAREQLKCPNVNSYWHVAGGNASLRFIIFNSPIFLRQLTVCGDPGATLSGYGDGRQYSATRWADGGNHMAPAPKVVNTRTRRLNRAGTLIVFLLMAGLVGLAAVFGYQKIWLPATAAKKPDAFTATRTGEILISSPDGTDCRKVRFNNQTGQMFSDGEISCDTVSAEFSKPPSGASRMEHIRDAFSKK